MRTPLLAVLLLAALAARAPASDAAEGRKRDHRPRVSSHQCGLGTPFNVLADGGGVWLYRDSGSPREIFFHDGDLSVDHKVRRVGRDDAQRLLKMERKARALMPQVAAVARDVVDIRYDALGGVVEIMTGSRLNAWKIERMRKRANAYVDDTLGKGRWDQDAFGGDFEKYVEDGAEQFKGSIARHLLWQIVTGRSGRMDARADKVGGELDARLDAKREAIEAEAGALCARVEELRRLQDALEFRYQGRPLRMLAPAKGGRPGGVDRPRGDAIEVGFP